MTEETLLQALRDSMTQRTLGNEGGHTLAEIVEITGVPNGRTRRGIRTLLEQGRLRVGRRQTTDIAGRAQLIPTYTVTE